MLPMILSLLITQSRKMKSQNMIFRGGHGLTVTARCCRDWLRITLLVATAFQNLKFKQIESNKLEYARQVYLCSRMLAGLWFSYQSSIIRDIQ